MAIGITSYKENACICDRLMLKPARHFCLSEYQLQGPQLGATLNWSFAPLISERLRMAEQRSGTSPSCSLQLDLHSQVVPLHSFLVPSAIVSSLQPEPKTWLFCIFEGIFQHFFLAFADMRPVLLGWEAHKVAAADFHCIGCCSSAFLLAFCQ